MQGIVNFISKHPELDDSPVATYLGNKVLTALNISIAPSSSIQPQQQEPPSQFDNHRGFVV